MAADNQLLAEYGRMHSDALLDEICRQYLPLAGAIARRFSGRGVDYDDLYQVASLALVKAVQRFDADKGVQFSTYVTPTIVGEVKNYFRDKSRTITLPRRSGALLRQIESAREKLTHALMRSPTIDELAAATGEAADVILEMLEMKNAMTPVSLDASPVSEDEDLTLQSALGQNDAGYEPIETQDAIHQIMRTLPESEKQLLKMRYFDGLSQREAAERLGVSQMTVSRMEKKALLKARELIEGE